MSTGAPAVVFSSERFGYHFALPTEGWLRYPASEESRVGADLLVEHPGIGAIKCMVTRLEADGHDLVDMALRAYQSDMREFRLLGSGAAEIAGIDGVYLEFDGIPHDSDGSRVCFLAYLFVIDGQLFQVIAFSSAETFSRLEHEAAAAVRSFGFGAVPQTAGAIDPVADDAVVPGAPAVIAAGLQWGVWGAIGGLCLGIFALSNGAGAAWLWKILLIPYFCLFFGCFGAGLRWGLIAGTTGAGMQVMDGLIWVACIPIHIMEFMLCTAFGVGSLGMAQLMTNMARLIYGFLSASLAGIPYAAYVIVTKRVHLNGAAYLFFCALGFFPCLFAFAFLMFLITGPIDETGGFPSAPVARTDTSPTGPAEETAVPVERENRSPEMGPGSPGSPAGHSGPPAGHWAPPASMPGMSRTPPRTETQPPEPTPADQGSGTAAVAPEGPGSLHGDPTPPASMPGMSRTPARTETQPLEPTPTEQQNRFPAMPPGMRDDSPSTETEPPAAERFEEPEPPEVSEPAGEPAPAEMALDAEKVRAAYESLKDHPDRAVRRRAEIWDGLMGNRQWTDASGRYTVEAKYLDHSESGVTLEKADGGEVTVELTTLDEADRKYVQTIGKMKPLIVEDLQRPRTMPEPGPRGPSKRSRR